MAKRRKLTAEDVVEHVMLDSDSSDELDELDYTASDMMVDDPYAPMAEGSDDEIEFSDVEDCDDIEEDTASPSVTTSPEDDMDLDTSHSQPAVPDSGTYQWSSTLKHIPQQPFTSPVGPTVPIPESPAEIFGMFFSNDLLESIVKESNRYAQQMMGQEKYSKWTPITVPELKAYFGFNILMGIVKLPTLDEYWKKDTHLHYSPIASRISRDRYRDIRRYLHYNSLTTPSESSRKDWLAKIRPLVEHVTKKCRELYQPHKDVAVDEAMVKFQGRSTLKQYVPLKPTKRGIKVWVLADSENGYFSNMQVYTGKESTAEKGLGARVVKDLTQPIKGKHHHVYFDNFFTSVKLLDELEKDGTYACGTAREDRKGFPTSLKKVKLDKRGDYKTVQSGKVSVTVWKDRKNVKVMSTNTDPTSVLRTQRDGSRLNIECPVSVCKYNLNMGAVDLGDQLRGYYRCRTKYRKFYMYIYSFFFDVAITNSFILYKHYSPCSKLKTILNFRLQLARELIGDYCTRRLPGAHSLPTRPLPFQHFPLKGPDGKRGWCHLCYTKQKRHNTRTPEPRWYCRDCHIWLCHSGNSETDCWLEWHKKLTV